jgi:hypothetical protein
MGARVGTDAGAAAPLNEKGYKDVAKLRSFDEMQTFIRRAVADQGMHVIDEASLEGVVPYYSGAKATQSFAALSAEIYNAASLRRSWVASEDPEDDIRKDRLDDHSQPGMASTRKTGVFVQTHIHHGSRSAKDQWMDSVISTFGEKADDDYDRDSTDEAASAVPVSPELERRQPRRMGSLVQTRSTSSSRSKLGWVASALGLVSGQAVYWLGARITLVACAGSILFGLFLFDESSHRARAAALELEHGFPLGAGPVPVPMPPMDGASTVKDHRPGPPPKRSIPEK